MGIHSYRGQALSTTSDTGCSSAAPLRRSAPHVSGGLPQYRQPSTPKPDLDAFLPFRPGFVKMTELAEKGGHTPVAIVPAGLTYTREQGERWDITVRFGPALFRSDFASTEQLLNAVEERVHTLSSAVPPRLS